jgi:phosphatidylserine/phosphatidylglycerophosphate/cardiolipin synthase-like enzyme
MNFLTKSLFLAFCFAHLIVCSQPVISVSDARNQAVGSTVSIKGIITNGDELGPIRYLEDGTGGIGIYDPNVMLTVQRGDSVIISGVLFDFNNLLEIQPVSNLQVLSQSNPLPTPLGIIPAQLDETVEGRLVKITNANFSLAGSTFSGNTSYLLTANGQNCIVYIRTNSPLVGSLIPFGPINVIGIASQFGTNYQLLPRDSNDFEATQAISIVSEVEVTDIQTSQFKLSFTTDSISNSFVRYGLTTNLELGAISGTQNTQQHEIILNGLNHTTFYYAKVFAVDGNDTAQSDIGYYSTASLSSGNIIAYFNHPVETSVSNGSFANYLPGTADDSLIAYINRARYSLDLTIYDFKTPGIADIPGAINAAFNRGVRVRFISDGSQFVTNSGVAALNPSIPRIQSPTSASYGIMHNKFVVIDADHPDPDSSFVWTGAMNWTDYQMIDDPNDILIIQDQSVAKAYELEFEEMWGDTGAVANATFSRFGQFKLDNTPHHFNVGGKVVEVYFSPSDNTNAKLLHVISEADQNLYFASMIITRQDLANAIQDVSNSGAEVFGITNDSGTNTQYQNLLSVLPIGHFVANPDTSIIMHHKYVLADQNFPSSDASVWTGSHNWSNNAQNRNDENSVLIHDADIANIYFQEFYALMMQSGGILLKSSSAEASTPVLIYPNPGIDDLNILTPIPDDEIEIMIFDHKGSLINRKQLKNGIKRIQTSDLAAGLYYITVKISGKTYSEKWMKTH